MSFKLHVRKEEGTHSTAIFLSLFDGFIQCSDSEVVVTSWWQQALNYRAVKDE